MLLPHHVKHVLLPHHVKHFLLPHHVKHVLPLQVESVFGSQECLMKQTVDGIHSVTADTLCNFDLKYHQRSAKKTFLNDSVVAWVSGQKIIILFNYLIISG